MAKKKKIKWFKKIRGSYLPCSWQGWLTYIPFVGYMVISYVYAINHFKTIAGIMFAVIPQWVAVTVVMTWLAQYKS